MVVADGGCGGGGGVWDEGDFVGSNGGGGGTLDVMVGVVFLETVVVDLSDGGVEMLVATVEVVVVRCNDWWFFGGDDGSDAVGREWRGGGHKRRLWSQIICLTVTIKLVNL